MILVVGVFATFGFIKDNPSLAGVTPDVQVQYVADPQRTVEVLNSIQLTDEQLKLLAPKDSSGNYIPVDKLLITDSPLEKYVADSILNGTPVVLGGTLNSWEIQTIVSDIAEKNGIINKDTVVNGNNLYEEIIK